MGFRFRNYVLAVALFAAIAARSADSPVAKASDLPYSELKELFAKDETLDGVRVTGFNAAEVTVVYRGRYINYERNKLSPAQKAVIDNLIAAETKRRAEAAAKEQQEASRAGLLREVDGVIYNLMNPSRDWITFKNARVLQKTEDGALVDIDQSGEGFNIVFVRNLPQFDRIADRDLITFMAKYTGTYTFVNTVGAEKTVHKYDCGTIPGKEAGPRLARAPSDEKPLLDPGWDSSGTGFFITSEGHFVTCHHVVESGKKFAIKTAAATVGAVLIAVDPTNDLAILKAPGTFSSLSISTNNVSLGQQVFTIGFPNIDFQGLAPKYTDGKISSLSGLRDNMAHMQISVPVQPGNSGGPLADSNGRLVGIVVARLSDYAALRRTRSIPQNVNYAIKSDPLLALARRAGLQNKISLQRATAERPVDEVQKATVLVLVGE